MKRWEFERAVLASDLPTPARLILLVLAVIADWPGGVIPAQFTPSLSTLQEMTGLSRGGLANHLNATEREGWVIRARPTKQQARAEKQRTRYRLAIPASSRDGLASASDGLASSGGGLELVHEVDGASTGGGHKPDPSRPSQTAAKNRGPERIVIDATGATPEEATAIVNRVRNERQPRSLGGLLRRMADDGDLKQLLIDQRAATRKAAVADALALARQGPECDHGVPGGSAPHPTSGEPICPQCRIKARRTALTTTTTEVTNT